MPLLLLLPLLMAALVLLWAVLLPLSLWARYRNGRARRRAQAWVVRGNAWLLLGSLPFYWATAWALSHWLDLALGEAAAGLLIGGLLGGLGLALTKFEHEGANLHYTPNRWLVLALTSVVAARVVLSPWLTWQRLATDDAAQAWIQAGSLLGVGGILLGYYLVYTWGLRARLPKLAR